MTSLIRMMSAFFLTLMVCLIVSTANGLDVVRAVQGSLFVAWLSAFVVGTISLVMASARVVLAALRPE